jgi:hypothetical protein
MDARSTEQTPLSIGPFFLAFHRFDATEGIRVLGGIFEFLTSVRPEIVALGSDQGRCEFETAGLASHAVGVIEDFK